MTFAGVIKSGRQDAAGGEDGDPECGSSGYFAVCVVQGEGREEGPFTLIEAGYDSSLDGDAYSSIFFQNANNSGARDG